MLAFDAPGGIIFRIRQTCATVTLFAVQELPNHSLSGITTNSTTFQVYLVIDGRRGQIPGEVRYGQYLGQWAFYGRVLITHLVFICCFFLPSCIQISGDLLGHAICDLADTQCIARKLPVTSVPLLPARYEKLAIGNTATSHSGD